MFAAEGKALDAEKEKKGGEDCEDGGEVSKKKKKTKKTAIQTRQHLNYGSRGFDCPIYFSRPTDTHLEKAGDIFSL